MRIWKTSTKMIEYGNYVSMRIVSSENNISVIDGNIDVIQIHDIKIVIYYWWNSCRYPDMVMEMIQEGYSTYKSKKMV